MKQRIGLLAVGFFVLGLWISSEALSGSTDFRRWAYNIRDVNRNPITIDTFLNKVTLVTFSTKESPGTAMRLGQEIGQDFGTRSAYQSLAIPNTSNVPYWAKFIADRKVAAFQRKAVEEALRRQKARGNHVTKDQIRKKIIFVNDSDGQIWKHLGVNPHSISIYVGIIDKSGNLVYLAESPINRQALYQRLEYEFQK